MNGRHGNKKLSYALMALMIIACVVLVLLTTGKNWVGMQLKNVFSISFDLVCAMGIVVFFVGVPRASSDDKRIRTVILMSGIVFLSVIVDVLRLMFQGNPDCVRHVYCCTLIFMLLNNLCSFLFYYFARIITKAKNSFGIPMALIWFAITGAFYLTNPLHGLLFSVDANANLVKNIPWYYMYLLYPLVVQISGLVLAYKCKIPKMHRIVFYFFNIVPIAASIAFNFVFGADLHYVAYTFSVIICYNVIFIDLMSENSSIKDSLGRYYSDNIVEHITDEAEGGSFAPRKLEVAIMAVDVRGFTAISERVEAKSLVDMVNHFFGSLSEIVEKNGGSVLEFLGDGFTATFEDGEKGTKSEIAVKTAIEIQLEVNNINRWNGEMGYPHIEAGIGIHAGEVIIGSYGSEKKSFFKLMGENAERAAYLESQCVGGDIVISDKTLYDINCLTDTESIYNNEIFRIYSLGEPFNKMLHRRENKMIRLVNPYPISFRFFTGKRIDNDYKMAYITAISDKELEIKTDEELDRICEIELLSVKYKFLYAKKADSSRKSAKFVFTSKPDNFQEWYKTVVSFTNKIYIKGESNVS